MTEDVTVEGGRLKVERVSGKDDVDVALSDVDSAHYERGVNGEGALVLHVKDAIEPIVIRVDQEDASEVFEAVISAVPKGAAGERPTVQASNSFEREANKPAQAPEVPSTPERNSQANQGRRANR